MNKLFRFAEQLYKLATKEEKEKLLKLLELSKSDNISDKELLDICISSWPNKYSDLSFQIVKSCLSNPNMSLDSIIKWIKKSGDKYSPFIKYLCEFWINNPINFDVLFWDKDSILKLYEEKVFDFFVESKNFSDFIYEKFLSLISLIEDEAIKNKLVDTIAGHKRFSDSKNFKKYFYDMVKMIVESSNSLYNFYDFIERHTEYNENSELIEVVNSIDLTNFIKRCFSISPNSNEFLYNMRMLNHIINYNINNFDLNKVFNECFGQYVKFYRNAHINIVKNMDSFNALINEEILYDYRESENGFRWVPKELFVEKCNDYLLNLYKHYVKTNEDPNKFKDWLNTYIVL